MELQFLRICTLLSLFIKNLLMNTFLKALVTSYFFDCVYVICIYFGSLTHCKITTWEKQDKNVHV